MTLIRIRQGAFALATVLLASCASHQEATASGAPLARQVTASDHCGLSAPGVLHLSEVAELDALAQLPSQTLNVTALREVDFNEEHLVVVALGQRTTSGYGITLASSQIIDDELQLEMDLRRPSPDSVVAQVMTTPCTVLAVTSEDWERITVWGEGMAAMTRGR